MTPPSDLSVSSTILPQLKSSAIVAIPSTLISTTQKTNQVSSVGLFVVLRLILLSFILGFLKLKHIFSCEFKCCLFGSLCYHKIVEKICRTKCAFKNGF